MRDYFLSFIGAIHENRPPGRNECLDGKFSTAAGRGACSHHGGLVFTKAPKRYRKKPVEKTPAHQAEKKPVAPVPQPVVPPAKPADFTDPNVVPQFIGKMNRGEVAPDQIKAFWQEVKANKELIIAGILTFKKKTLLYFAGGFPSSSDTKKDLAGRIWRNWIRAFIPPNLNEDPSSMMTSYSYSLGQTVEQKVDAEIEGWTQAHIDYLVKSVAARQAAKDERKAAREKALTNPESWKEFQTFLEAKGRSEMTPEQQSRYYELVASKRAERAERQDEKKRTVEAFSSSDNVSLELIKSRHTKKGIDIWVVRLPDRVPKETYQRLNNRARALDGYYSRYRGQGAIPGFIFESEEGAKKFLSLEKVVKEKDEQNPDRERLRSMAQRMIEKGTETLNADRKTNTARRARMAAGVMENAEAEIQYGEVLTQLADDIEAGRLRFLDKLRYRTDYSLLRQIMRAAIYSATQAENLSYTEREQREVQFADLRYTAWPWPAVHYEMLERVALEMMNTPGAKMIGKYMYSLSRKKRPKGEHLIYFKGYDLSKLREAAGKMKFRGTYKYWWEGQAEKIKDTDRLLRMGITNLDELRGALRELWPYVYGQDDAKDARAKEHALRLLEMEAGLYKSKGYFPTPDSLVQRMIDEADLRPGQKILEPSAGKGNIVEAIVNHQGNQDHVDVVELDAYLVRVMRTKGYQVNHQDFFSFNPGPVYDRILMNPPFEQGQDIDHVQHAYTLLKPGGRLVAIMGAGPFFRKQSKYSEFRTWLEKTGGAGEKLPEGAFLNAERSTGVQTYLVVIDKPAAGIGCPGKVCRCTYVGAIVQDMRSGAYRCVDGKYSTASGRGDCAHHGGLQARRGCPPGQAAPANAFAIWIPVAQIHTDTKRFQNREAEFSNESVQRIIRSYDPNRLDPVRVWKDPKDGKIYMLSGHSRLEAHRRLKKPMIPAVYFEGPEAAAIRFSRIDANRGATAETLLESVRAFVLDRDGDQARGIVAMERDRLRQKWGKEYNALQAFSFLDPKGKFLQTMNSQARKQFPRIEVKAMWAGQLRSRYPRLRNFHENEIFEFLFSQKGMDMKKEDFLRHFSAIVDRLDFDPDKPLNLHRSANRGTNARSDTGPAMVRLREIEQELSRNRSRIQTATTREERSALSQMNRRLVEERERLNRNVKQMVENQTALFGIAGNRRRLGIVKGTIFTHIT